MARRVCGADRGSLFLVATKPTPHLWSKVAEEAKPITIAWNQGIAGAVAATGDALNIEDAYQDARFSRAHDDQVCACSIE
jgi:adenylate cyclase